MPRGINFKKKSERLAMQDIITFLSSHLLLTTAAILLFISIVVVEIIRARRRHFSVVPQQAVKLINHEHAVVLDMRPTTLFHKGHILNAISISPADLKPGSKKLDKYKSKPIILICRLGSESQKIAENLIKNGYNANSLAGGMQAWVDAQLPVIKE